MKKGWEIKPLGEICVVDWGNTDLTKSAYVEGGKFLAVSAAGCDGRIGHKEHAKLTPVLSAIGAQCGRMFLPDEDFTAIKNTITLTPRDGVCTGRFLYQLLTHVELPKRGAAQPFIAKGDILKFAVPVPPLAEQQRIVGVLDEAFAGLATAQANAEKNLQNARALFESHLQSVFSHPGKDWVEKTLGEAFDVRDGTHDSPKYYATGSPLITSKNLKREGLSFEDVNLINADDYAKINQRSAVHKGDVLFAMIGTIGNPTLVTVEPNFAIKNVALFKNPHGQNSAFLKHYLASAWVITKMIQEAKGTTQKFVGLGYLRSFPINLPPVAEQKQIVVKLDALATETQRLESLYRQKLAALGALKKSLLHQAFTGEL